MREEVACAPVHSPVFRVGEWTGAQAREEGEHRNGNLKHL
jgi:hypothetical protein